MLEGTGVIAFIGAGKMATAIAAGLAGQGMDKESIRAYDVSETAAENFRNATGVKCSATMEEALKGCGIAVLAVKPQFAASALAEARNYLAETLLVSIAAGIKIKTLIEHSGCLRVIRVMPNTPALVGEGVSCYAGAPNIASSDLKAAEAIFSAVGQAFMVHESQMDAITGLSGSGPAYVLEFIMALADGGVHAGLPRELATKIAVQTVLGTSKMASLSPRHLSSLRDDVISPGGTTSRGMMSLERGAFSATVSSAVIASAERSAELSSGAKS